MLHRCILAKRLDAVQSLLEAGDMADGEMRTPLHQVADVLLIGAVPLLLQHGANLVSGVDRMT